jgi:hypothetical protein
MKSQSKGGGHAGMSRKEPRGNSPHFLRAYMTDDELVDIVEYLFTLKEESK